MILMDKSTVTEIEESILKSWKKNKIFEKSIEQHSEDKQYIFYDGPPFATGLPHYGHILGLTCKDLYPRYWTMKGWRVERRWGWDCHGLPIENIAEKELGIKKKEEIEEMGIAKFNEFCRSKVLFFAKEWEETVTRMGKWIDFNNAYKTMDNSYLETVWHIFKKLYDDKFIYEGKKVLLYCPRCETPLSNSEIAMDQSYKTVTEKSVTAKFKLKDDDASVLAWTTTPWTLIGNVALAVNEALTYVKIQLGSEKLILAKDRLQEIEGEYTILAKMKGKDLLNKEYEPLYHTPSDKKGHYIVNGGKEVSAEEGTGIVHMAIYGEFDYEMIKKYDLPIIQHVGPHGTLVAGPEEMRGTWFKKADAKVLEDLEERNLLYNSEAYTHPYPFCYRCETPLFYNAVDSWFVDIQKIKPKLLERNKDINWYPDHLKEGRFKHILETAPDWSISRNRFWATAIPVWKCEECKKVTVIGSIAELQKKAVGKVPDDVDLHKHIVDEIKLRCDDCPGKMTRIPEVFDCWFESGSMPYAAKHYPFENKDWFQTHFPADFISEYIAQVRAWFYYMHVLSVLLFDKAPFKNVVVSGNVLTKDGTKMSKSKNNYPDPKLIFDKYGADALRFYLMASPLMKAQDLNFNEEKVNEIYRKVMVLLNNVGSFYGLFAKGNTTINEPSTKDVLDRWIVHKTHLLVRDVTHDLDNYNTVGSCSKTLQFIEDLSTWYVRRSRDRFKGNNAEPAVKTLGFVLHTVARVIAPTTPFIAEHIYQLLKEQGSTLDESVHLDTWPEFDAEKINEQLDADMTTTREVVSLALKEREEAKIPIRQPLGNITITCCELDEEFLAVIRDELNIKETQLKKGDKMTVTLDTNITPELEAEGFAREIIRRVQNMRKKEDLQPSDRIVLAVSGEKELLSRIAKHDEIIQEKVGASKLVFVEELPAKMGVSKEVSIRGKKFGLGFDQE
ncbi:isoleucine--tRNA ligase [Candidatus Woesearchaeota archaeon]|nr:isoleucine--tRNA ligase [Candidatus Woesearchaeota archaeon]